MILTNIPTKYTQITFCGNATTNVSNICTVGEQRQRINYHVKWFVALAFKYINFEKMMSAK